MKLPRIASLLLVVLSVALAASSSGCSEEETTAAHSPDTRAATDAEFAEAARATIRGYAKVGRAVHDETVRLCKLLEKAIEDFIKAPSPELLADAKIAWRTARDAYSRAEAFRFTGSLLDEDTELAARIEAAPVDVTLLEGSTLEAGGILDELMNVPDVTGEAVRDAARGKDVRLGWHAIEGMLYGAAVTRGEPPRPHTDFAYQDLNERNARRGRLLAKLARILIEDVELVANQWDADRTNSIAQKLVRGPLDDAFGRALGGVTTFVRREMVERKLDGVLSGASEISEASGSTQADLVANSFGVEGLLFAREGRVTAPSFVDLVRRDAPALAEDVASALASAKAAIDACPPALAEGASDSAQRTVIENARDAQLALAVQIEELLRHFAIPEGT